MKCTLILAQMSILHACSLEPSLCRLLDTPSNGSAYCDALPTSPSAFLQPFPESGGPPTCMKTEEIPAGITTSVVMLELQSQSSVHFPRPSRPTFCWHGHLLVA
jgi:hypothetical protein